MSFDALVRAARRSRRIMAEAVVPPAPLSAGQAFASAAHPDIRLVNFVGEVLIGSADDAGEVLEEISTHFTEAGSVCHVIEPAGTEVPEALRAAARSSGFQVLEKILLRLEDYEPVAPVCDLQLVPIRAAMPELAGFYRAVGREGLAMPDGVAEQFAEVMVDRLDDPRLELFVARDEAGPMGVAGVLSLGQIGVLEPAFVLPRARGQGAAKRLLHHTIDHCARAMFQEVVLSRSVGCDSIPLYESLGFRAVGVFQVLVRADRG